MSSRPLTKQEQQRLADQKYLVINSDNPVKVLFVCYGNTCRSPMAEAIFKNLLKQHNHEDKFEVDSAGISDWQAGQEPNDYVKVIMERYKIPIDHQARQITLEDISRFDFLIGMDHYNINELERYVTAVKSDAKVLLLGDYNSDPSEKVIRDPYFDKRKEDFEKCYEQIDNSCKELVKLLLEKRDNEM